MARVLVIGCGNVGSVGLHKMAQMPEIFSSIHVASRSGKKAERVKESIQKKFGYRMESPFLWKVDASNKEEFLDLLKLVKPHLVIHWGHPYDNLTIMQVCLECGVPYIDTACYEKRDKLGFSYKRQWAMDKAFKKKKLLALTGIGFDPGTTNVFCAYARDYLFDKVHTIDILDCNGGSKDAKFAPNFDPEINLRELILPVKFWQNGKWEKRGQIFDKDAAHFSFDFPYTGVFTPYLMYHEEMESLVEHMPDLKRIRFWMTFDEDYLTHLRVLNDVGLTRIDEVVYDGHRIVPVKFLKTLLPKGDDFNKSYFGKTCIGCIFSGIKNNRKVVYFIYQVCDHHEAFLETGGNAIGYTTAVPTVTVAKLLLQGKWGRDASGVRNAEDPIFDSKTFLNELAVMGLPWKIMKLEEVPKPLRRNY